MGIKEEILALRAEIEMHNKRYYDEDAPLISDFEYDKLGLPRPDLTIYLDVPTDFTQKLLRHREADTNTTADIHEKDMAYLATCRKIGRNAAQFYGWTVVNCVRDGQMRSIEDIHQEIYAHVKKCLED